MFEKCADKDTNIHRSLLISSYVNRCQWTAVWSGYVFQQGSVDPKRLLKTNYKDLDLGGGKVIKISIRLFYVNQNDKTLQFDNNCYHHYEVEELIMCVAV